MKDEMHLFTQGDNDDIIDISSCSTPKSVKHKKVKKENPVSIYGNTLFNGLGTIIKAISFIVAIALIALGVAIALLLIYFFDSLLLPVAIGIVIVGTIIAAFTFFIIFGIGHAICQNDEILKRLRKR